MAIRVLSPELQKLAEEQLNEIPSQITFNLDLIKDWIRKQPHLKCRMDDQWLLAFLRGCKFSLEKTKKKLDYYYTIRSAEPEVFLNRSPFSPKIQEYLQAANLFPLPKSDDTGAPRTFIIHSKNYDTDTMIALQPLKMLYMMLDSFMNYDDNCVIAGLQVLINLDALDYKKLLHITPKIVQQLIDHYMNAYPIRVSFVYIINCPSFFETVMSICKLLLPEKLFAKIKVCTSVNMSEIYESIPRSILPTEYGGTAGTIQELGEQWKNELESYAEWFKEEENYGVDEHKRIEKVALNSDLLGTEGSFRTLTID